MGHFPLSSGEWIPPHGHPHHHQLAWTRRGVLGIAVDDKYWVLPPTGALWLPAGVLHRTGATRDAVPCGIYLGRDRCGVDWTEPTLVAVNGLLAHLFAYLSRDDLPKDARLRAESVLPDLLHPLPALPIDVPQPVDDTGMSFDRWRVHVRLRAALSLLAEGQPVSRVAHAVGYATPSAFLAAFRRTVGTTPGRNLDGDVLAP
nr:AraC family transcriptional regulator [Streptomyces sp. RTd22]